MDSANAEVKLLPSALSLVIGANDSLTVQAIVLDGDGVPVPNALVRFSVVGPGVLTPFTTDSQTDALGSVFVGLRLAANAAAPDTIAVTARVGDITVVQNIAVVADTQFGRSSPEKIVLVADGTELLSGAVFADDGLRITALVTDGNNRLLDNVNINFGSTQVNGDTSAPGGAGALTVTRQTTDSTGTAEVVLSTANNARGRQISISASADGFPDATNVNDLVVTIVGTTLELSGPSTLGANQQNVEYLVRLNDSSGRGIEGESITLFASSGSGEIALLGPLETDTQGLARFKVNATDLPALQTTLRAEVFQAESVLDSSLTVVVTPVEVQFVAENGGFDIDNTPAGEGTAQVPLPAEFTQEPFLANSSVQVPLSRCLATRMEFNLSGGVQSEADVLAVGDAVDVAITRGRIYSSLDNCRTETSPISRTTILSEQNNSLPGQSCRNGGSCFVGQIFVRSEGVGGAGPAILSAEHKPSGATALTRVDAAGEGASIEFVALDADRIELQVQPATVPVSGESNLVATVRDDSNNIVKGRFVDFTLEDPTGGRLSATSALTDSTGSASVKYLANSISSALNGVTVRATVRGSDPSITTSSSLTVGSTALRITIGTGNEIREEQLTNDDGSNAEVGNTIYAQPYAVIVTDAAGNPAPPDTIFRLKIEALAYQKGCYIFDSLATVWVPLYRVLNQGTMSTLSVSCDDEPQPVANNFGLGCLNEDRDGDGIVDPTEDLNGNGVLDAGEDANGNGLLDVGEDLNGNGQLDVAEDRSDPPNGVIDPISEDTDGDGRLDPGNVVTVPATVDLNENGIGFFDLRYPQDVASWTRVRLTATALVSGTEAIEQRVFVLPVLADDVNSPDVSPPGVISPFGVSTSCAIDG